MCKRTEPEPEPEGFYALSASANPPEAAEKIECTPNPVPMATPNANCTIVNKNSAYDLKGWMVTASGSSPGAVVAQCAADSPTNTCKLQSIDGSRTLVANFERKTVQITTAIVSQGGSPTDGSVDCVPNRSNPGVNPIVVDYGSNVTCSATPAANSGKQFKSWSGGNCDGKKTSSCPIPNITLATTETAEFESIPQGNVGVNVSVDPANAGMAICSDTASGTSVQSIAVGGTYYCRITSTDPGYTFDQWTGACTGSSATCSNSSVQKPDKNIVAKFVKKKILALAAKDQNGNFLSGVSIPITIVSTARTETTKTSTLSLTLSPSETSVNLPALASHNLASPLNLNGKRYAFAGWECNSTTVLANTQACSLTMDADKYATARYKEIFSITVIAENALNPSEKLNNVSFGTLPSNATGTPITAGTAGSASITLSADFNGTFTVPKGDLTNPLSLGTSSSGNKYFVYAGCGSSLNDSLGCNVNVNTSTPNVTITFKFYPVVTLNIPTLPTGGVIKDKGTTPAADGGQILCGEGSTNTKCLVHLKQTTSTPPTINLIAEPVSPLEFKAWTGMPTTATCTAVGATNSCTGVPISGRITPGDSTIAGATTLGATFEDPCESTWGSMGELGPKPICLDFVNP